MMRKFVVFLATICILFAPAIAETPNKTAHRADYAVVSADTNTSRAATTRGASVTNRSGDALNRAGAPRDDKGRTITTRSESSNTRATSATRGTTSRTARTNNVVNRTSAASNVTTRTNASTARTATASRVSRTATTTAPQTARTRAATNTVQNAARARTATSTNMTRHAASATNAVKTGTRRARTVSSLDTTATITDTCREQYTQCMDNFCNVLDDNQGRCSCSKNIKNYAKTEEALKLATESLQDVAQQIQYIGLTGDEIETLFTQTEAEIAMQSSTDNSQIKNDLDKIRGLIVDVKTGTASSTETGLSFDLSGLLDFSIDSTGFDLGSLFGGNQTNTSSISNQRGEQLYKTAAARCKKSVLDSCAKSGANTTLIANTYDMEIDRACVAYERSLTDQNDEMVHTVRNANTVLQKARLMVAQQKNTYDLRGCLNALDSCMQDDFVCGTDYELCLDPTGKYIVDGAIVTGSTPGFVMTDAITDPMPAEYSRGTLMGSWTYNNDAKFAWAAENEDGTLAEYIANTVSTTPVTSTSTNLSEFLQHKIGYIDNRNKPQGMCGTVLTKCQAITMDKDGKYNPSNRLITEYLTRTLTQIKLAQDKILSAHASACIADVESCLNTNNYSGTNTSAANIAINACRAQIKTCMSVNGNTSANPTPEIMKNWIAAMMTDEAQNLCLLTGGTWDSNSNDCTCPSGYLPDDNGTCKTTTAINPFNPSNNPTTQTTMVLKKSVKHTDGSASAIVRDTDTGILFTTVVQADGTTDDSVDAACVISSTSTTVNQNTCDDENTVTLFNGAGGATFAVRRALTDPEEMVSFTFNGDTVSYLNLALENGKLPSDVSWVLNLSTPNYIFAGITDESGTPYYDKNAKRIQQTPPTNSELYITFEHFSNAHLACISNNYGTWDSDTGECNCTSDRYRLNESTGVCEPIDSRELNCTNSGGVWTNGACNCDNKFGTSVKNNKCICDAAKNAQGTASKTSDCSCKSGYKETDDGTACEWDYTESINACTNSGGTWNDTDHTCDCSGKFGAKADGYKCVCDTSKNVAENNELTTDTECTCIDWHKQDTANNMCVTDETAIGCRNTAGTWDPDSDTCACNKDNMSVDPTDKNKCACNTGWTLNSDNTACIVNNAYTKCVDSGGEWTNGACNCDNKFGTIESDGVCICDSAKNTTGNPTRDKDCACADGYYKETEASTQCTFDTAAKNCTDSGGEWNGQDRTCACNGDNQEQGDNENTCKCSDGYQLNDNNTACIATTDNTNCTNSGGTWTNGACTCPNDQTWDGTACKNGQSGGTINKQQLCTNAGGTWSGTTCECPEGKNWLNNQCVTVTVNNCGEGFMSFNDECIPDERPEECTDIFNSKWDNTTGCSCDSIDGIITDPDSPSTCICDTDNGYTGIAPSCAKHNCTLENTTWNGSECVCMENYTYNNGVCEYTPCITSGGEWNSSTQKCVCNKNNINTNVNNNTCYCNINYTIQDVDGILHCVHNNCTAAGGTWNRVNTTCTCPGGLIWGWDTNNELNCITSPKSTCENTGGTWAGTTCECPDGQTWNGTACQSSQSGNTCPDHSTLLNNDECACHEGFVKYGQECIPDTDQSSAYQKCTQSGGTWQQMTGDFKHDDGTPLYECYCPTSLSANKIDSSYGVDRPMSCECSNPNQTWNDKAKYCECMYPSKKIQNRCLSQDEYEQHEETCTTTYNSTWSDTTGCLCDAVGMTNDHYNPFACSCDTSKGYTGGAPNCTKIDSVTQTACEESGGSWVDRSSIGMDPICSCGALGLERAPNTGLCRCTNGGTYSGSNGYGIAYCKPTNNPSCPGESLLSTVSGQCFCNEVLVVDGYTCVLKSDYYSNGANGYKYVLEKTTQQDKDYLEYPVRSQRPLYGETTSCTVNKDGYYWHENENVNPNCSLAVFNYETRLNSSYRRSVKTTIDNCWSYVSLDSDSIYEMFTRRNINFTPMGLLSVAPHATKLYSAQCMFAVQIPETEQCYIFNKGIGGDIVMNAGDSAYMSLIDCSLLESINKKDMIYQESIQSGGGLVIEFPADKTYMVKGSPYTSETYRDNYISTFIPLDTSKKPASLAHYVDYYTQQHPECKFLGVFGAIGDMDRTGNIQFYDTNGNWIENKNTAQARTPYVGLFENRIDRGQLNTAHGVAKWSCN